jgi:hypothetical protein
VDKTAQVTRSEASGRVSADLAEGPAITFASIPVAIERVILTDGEIGKRKKGTTSVPLDGRL